MLNFLERHKKIAVYFPLISYWLILIIATSLPSKDIPSIKLNDKIEHLLAYFILGFLFNIAVLVQNKFTFLKEKAFFSTIIFLGIYAIIDELHQLFIPGRDCSFLDWSADLLGVVFGVLLTYFLLKKFN
ncbi:MAG: VanZ family protein [Bacteroidetes bacterium]|nr:VanZ family protein [Bacteroidota bacterium]